MYMDISDIKWAAGFFQGEGWLGLQNQKRKSLEDYVYPCMKITQYNDRIPLDLYRDIFDIGSVGGPYIKTRGDSEVYQYNASGEGAIKIATIMLPYLLGKKHIQVSDVISNYNIYLNKPRVVSRRKIYCKNGHKFNNENTYIRKDGTQICRPCHNAAKRKYRRRN